MLRLALHAGVIALLTLAMLEGLLRIVGVASLVLYEADPQCGYRLQPRQSVRLRGNTISINSWGVRDARPLLSLPPSGRRILVLGDSVTWGGVYVNQEELFTSVLEAKLVDTEVVNAGVNGYSVAQMAALYDTRLRQLQPTTVVLFAIPRDFTRPPLVFLTGDSVAFPTERPALALPVAAGLFRQFAYDRFRWEWLRPQPATLPPSPQPSAESSLQDNVNAVEELRTSLGQSARLLVVLFPTPVEPAGSPALASVEQALSERGVEHVNLGDKTKLSPDCFLDGVHLTAEGHRRVGEALAALVKASE